MSRLLKAFAFAVIAMAVSVVYVLPADAVVTVFKLHDHPNGAAVPPEYGLRLDNLIGTGTFTFSFDYMDVTGSADVTLTYDDVLNEVRIYGRAYGGKDTGAGWDPGTSGWVDIDFTYDTFVNVQDDCGGSPGDDIYVTGESANNTGTVSLDGWGGNAVYNFDGKANGTGCALIFDNDTDSKGNAGIANDPQIYSGSGWLQPPTDGFRDWLFIAEMRPVPVESHTWGSIKAQYQ